MAKEDFCFTYYDGDAARDTTHMNRLERGAYHDLVISQRKFGHLSLDQVKKILGRDFTECWPAIELIMKVDSDDKFFIEWLDDSIRKMRAHSKKQSQNVTKRYQQPTKPIPNDTTVTPLEDGDGSGYEDENRKEGSGEKTKVPRGTAVINFTNPDVEGEELVFPVDNKPIRELWAKWKEYRYREFGMRYPMMGEQADLKRLTGLSPPDVERTILTAMANKWKNLYPEKSKQYAPHSRTLAETGPAPGKDYSERF